MSVVSQAETVQTAIPSLHFDPYWSALRTPCGNLARLCALDHPNRISSVGEP